MAIYSQQQGNSSNTYSGRIRGMLASSGNRSDPVAAIVERASRLVVESGLSNPPFSPNIYAQLRNVGQIVESDIKIDGRLVPSPPTFTIELRRDRPFQRKNFTCAHEVAHTFFALSPSLATGGVYPSQEPDAMEETLCNLAAAELLMPKEVITAVGTDYVPRPESLLEIASLFGTSLSATAIRLMKLKIWNVGFVMWSIENGALLPRWICKRTGMFTHRPSVGILSANSSSVFQTLKTGGSTSEWEYLQTSSGLWPCYIQTVRLNSHRGLSMIGSSSVQILAPAICHKSTSPCLAMHYKCRCAGIGWILKKERGRTVASRCLAKTHNATTSQN